MMRVKSKNGAVGVLASVLAVAGFAGAAHAQDVGAFYAGKNISIIVGFGPGGGYDLYARLLARYYGPHIPGKPNVIVQNMPGAGGVNAANYVYNTAAKDGTVIAGVNQGAALFQQLGGKGAQYDASKFRWIGRMASSNNVAYTWTASGVRSIEDAKQREVIMAGSGVISDANIYPNVMNGLLKTRFKIINGYAGTNESNLALERGEVQGRGGGSYSSLQTTRPQWLKDGSISLLVQIGLEKEPDLPNVPRLLDLVSSEQDRQIALLVTLPVEIGYNYWVAPDVPADRVSALRTSFEAALKDPALLAEAKKISLDIRYKSGAELEKMVSDASKTPPDVLKRAAQILGW
ncbi:MAG: Bug family tripartite tricarboxylate transporter substrate binding protein [Beijerinckiaceae bacterium]